MKRVLGLDLGTTSIGWALVNEADNKEEQSSIVKMGVRVVPLTVDEQQNYGKGKDIQTNAARTMKRSMRRNLQRYKLRRQQLVECLKEHHLITDETALCEDGPRTTFQTYRLRAQAASQEITLEEFARVLLMINKKRGYKSSRKAAGGDEGSLIDGMEIAKRLYDENLTPGQYVMQLLNEGKKYVPDFYRSDLRDELDRIWAVQSSRFPAILTQDLRNTIEGRGKNDVSKIFYARHGVNTAQNKGKDKRLQVYRWRVAALTDPLTIDEVAYVICEICGQMSGSSSYLGGISDRSKELYFGHLTVGQYFMRQLDADPNVSLKNQVFYRQDYLDEFETLWEAQRQYHPELTPALKHELRDIIIFYQRTLRSQSHLVGLCEFESQRKTMTIDGKVKEKLIGLKVCPKSSPLFQEFKVWQVLNNVKVTTPECDEPIFLSLEQKQLLAERLEQTPRLTKTEALRMLYKKPKGYDLNYKELLGNETMTAMLNACRTIVEMSGHDDAAKMCKQDIVEVFTALGFKTDYLYPDNSVEGKAFCQQPHYRLWHLLFSYEGDNSKTGNEKLIEHLMALTLMPREYAQVLASVTFKEDYGNLSAKALRKILPYMKEGTEYSVACQYAGYRHSAHSLTREEIDTRELKDTLDVLPRNSLRNPVVEKILNQMIHVVNGITEQYGKPDEIRVEMARELKKSKKEREEATTSINATTRDNESYTKILQEEFGIQHVSRNDLIRYRLYLELKDNGYKTLYTNTYIPREKLFSRDFDIEHIIPQARLFDDSFSNKTLEARQANIDKGKLTALDYVATQTDADGLQQYRNRVEALFAAKAISKTKRNKLLMKDADIPEDFLNRDLTNTQYIARQAISLLEQLVRTVVPTTGSVTDRLRDDWQLMDLMQELNWEKYDRQGMTYFYQDRDGRTIGKIKDWTKRNDHRHHAMDALTIAFTRPAFIQYLNNLSARSDKAGSIYGIEQKWLYRSDKGKLRFLPPMPLDVFRAAAREQLEAIFVSHKAKNKVMTENVNHYRVGSETRTKAQLTPRGQLHNETVYGQIQQYVTTEVAVGAKLTVDVAAQIADQRIREAVLARLEAHDGNAKKAFTGKNSLDKNPIWLDDIHSACVPAKVKLVELQKMLTIRKPVDANLKVEKVVDPQIRQLLEARLAEYDGKSDKAFANLAENPIWLNEEKGIQVKRVSIFAGYSVAEPLHQRHDHHGRALPDAEGNAVTTDFVVPGSNHHIAFYRDAEGNVQDVAVSFLEAVARREQNLPIIDRQYRADDGWTFLFSMKQNEYFVFPNEEKAFYPKEVDLMDPANAKAVSENLFRVQKFSKTDSGREYFFRHHLETTLNDTKEMLGYTFKRCKSLGFVSGIVKVRVNHLGVIVSIGEEK